MGSEMCIRDSSGGGRVKMESRIPKSTLLCKYVKADPFFRSLRKDLLTVLVISGMVEETSLEEVLIISLRNKQSDVSTAVYTTSSSY